MAQQATVDGVTVTRAESAWADRLAGECAAAGAADPWADAVRVVRGVWAVAGDPGVGPDDVGAAHGLSAVMADRAAGVAS